MVVSKCERCHKKPYRELLPLWMLGEAWWKLVDRDPSFTWIKLCDDCFKVARSREGRILGYTTQRGKTRAYVEEEVFGPPIESTGSGIENLRRRPA